MLDIAIGFVFGLAFVALLLLAILGSNTVILSFFGFLVVLFIWLWVTDSRKHKKMQKMGKVK
jgi:Flp pilus assembly protein TadB